MNISNMTTEEIKAESKKISHQISELKIKLREINEIEIKRSKENLKQYVGKCYAVRPYGVSVNSPAYKYTKIIEVPQEQYTMNGTVYNENQLPAFSFWVKDQQNILKLDNHFNRQDCDEREFGFDADTVFLGTIVGNRISYGDMVYQEITQKEFNEALNKHLKCLYEAVTRI